MMLPIPLWLLVVFAVAAVAAAAVILKERK